jgi:hypothetical protein
MTSRPLILPFAIVLWAACGNPPCSLGESHCLGGNVVESCEDHGQDRTGGIQWTDEPCAPGYCVTAEGQSFCSPASTTQAVCAGVEYGGTYTLCFQNAPATCVGGYVEEETSPGMDCGIQTCVVKNGVAACE